MFRLSSRWSASSSTVPEALLSVYLAKGRFYSSTVSRVDQRILAKFISGGYFERHLDRMREIYKGIHDARLGELKPLEKRFEITGEFAGLHVLLKDRKKEPEQQLLEKAAEKKLKKSKNNTKKKKKKKKQNKKKKKKTQKKKKKNIKKKKKKI